MAKNFVPADDGLVTDAFLKVAGVIDSLRASISALQAGSPGTGGSGPSTVSISDNGDGTATLTITAGSSASLVDNGDGTATLTI